MPFPSFLPSFRLLFRFYCFFSFSNLMTFCCSFFLFPRLSNFFFPHQMLLSIFSLLPDDIRFFISHCNLFSPLLTDTNRMRRKQLFRKREREKMNEQTNERAKTKRWQLHSLPPLTAATYMIKSKHWGLGCFRQKTDENLAHGPISPLPFILTNTNAHKHAAIDRVVFRSHLKENGAREPERSASGGKGGEKQREKKRAK